MTTSSTNSSAILGLLSGKRSTPVERDPWNSVAGPTPMPKPTTEQASADPCSAEQDAKLAEMLARIQQMTSPDSCNVTPLPPPPPLAAGEPATAAGNPGVPEAGTGPIPPLDAFIPLEPSSIRQAGLTDSEIESLILKYLLSRGDMTGREIAEQVCLPFVLLDQIMRQLKLDQLLIYRGSAPMNDYVYQLTDLGRERARRYLDHCTYYGAAPVALSEYIASVKVQSLTGQHPSEADLCNAFSDILVSQRMLTRLGPAINSGLGMFLFGSAGNGKTTIAERVTRAFGQFIWIPRAIGIDGEIIRLFDPVNHEECPPPVNSTLWNSSKIDKRWVRVRRPTIVVGGELTMDSLEVCLNRSTGISEAPLQLKSNCGTLVIDDFGRQKMSIDQLLNRWIVPLEKRYDYLNLPNGKKIQVPFDQLIIFSTNLEPRDLVDEAFLRRIPYKIEVVNPSEEEFRSLFKLMCPRLGFEYDDSALTYLIETHYKAKNRPFRACQPRDLLTQVKNHCYYKMLPPKMNNEYFDLAIENYFAVM
jgi:DNA-binding PadR family transcriptional regulator